MTTKLINGIKLIEEHDMVCRASVDGKFEPETFQYLHLIKPKHFIDIGAYTGIYSLYCAEFFGAHCIAFEPNPTNFVRLSKNIYNNNLSHKVQACDSAISSHTGMIELYSNPNTKMSSGGSLIPSKNKSKVDAVFVESLDDFIADGNEYFVADCIKIDVESNELAVLKGAINYLKKHKPILIVECLTESELKQVTQYLQYFDYVNFHCFDQRNYVFGANA